MATKTEGARDLGFVLSEANGKRSRDVVTIADGAGVLAPGTVLGAITANGHYTISANAEVVDSEGAETALAVLAYGVDATDSAVEAVVISADAEVIGAELVYDASVDNATKIAAKATQLAAVGIKVR